MEARMRTASQLYQEKLVRKLMILGGPGENGVSEAEAMQKLAVEFGVPQADLVLVTSGADTEAAVKSSLERCEEGGLHNLLAVSDFYLLPRIKLCYRRHGKEVDTVPADQPDGANSLRELRHALVEEATALWVFYLQPLVL
jgi:vancomycin permeability regulator SanA